MRVILMLFVLHQSTFLLSQTKILGIPDIQSFSKKDYEAGTANWALVATGNGNILSANNSGLLDYNGVNWQLRRMPNGSIARSVTLAQSGRIYCGGQDEVGYYIPDSLGQLEFVSIRHEIPSEYLPLEDVWECKATESTIAFRSSNKVYVYEEGRGFEVIEPKSAVISIDIINGELYYTDIVQGIVSISSRTPLSLKGVPVLGMQIVDVLPFSKRELLILTEQDGGYIVSGNEVSPLKKKAFDLLKSNRVNCAVAINNDKFAIGTQFGGIVIIDQSQDVISVYDKSSGIINNNVRSLVNDSFGNLWAGTSNGISKLDLSSRIRRFSPDGDDQSSAYDIALAGNQLYVGTSSGLYATEIASLGARYTYDGFEKIPDSDGQVWSINVIGDNVLVGHNDGPFLYRNGNMIRCSDRPGIWKFIPTKTDYLYVGTYTGVDIYRWDSNTIPRYIKSLNGFAESSRIIISVRDNELWVSHPYRGVYRITHNDEFENVVVEKYSEASGLLSGLGNYIFDVDGVPTVTGNTGVYSYDRAANRFRENNRYDVIDAQRNNVRRLINNGYYIAEHEVGKLKIDRTSKDTIKHIYPELKDVFVGGFETMVELDSTHLLACTDNGVILYNSEQNESRLTPEAQLIEVRLATADSRLLSASYGIDNTNNLVLQSEENAIRFLFNCKNHGTKSTFRYRLIGLEDEWSDWDNAISKEYNNLSHSEYSFQVQTADLYGNVSEPVAYDFQIKAPWYLSAVAKLIYSVLVLGGFLLLYLIPRKKYKSETKELQLANQQSEEEIEILKTQQLETEIIHKNAQLASSTLHLVQKNETINRIRTEIESVRKKVKDPEVKRELKKVISVLSDDERLEDDWESFSQHFDQVHSDFLKRLKTEYPQLTRKDQKMAAYLRMNLSTKEIAPLLGISVRGVEIGRYRLRKKMMLDTGVKLRKYMVEY